MKNEGKVFCGIDLANGADETVIVIGSYAFDRKRLCEALHVEDVRYDAATQTLRLRPRACVDHLQLELGFVDPELA